MRIPFSRWSDRRLEGLGDFAFNYISWIQNDPLTEFSFTLLIFNFGMVLLKWFGCLCRYGVLKIREYCLDVIACNFETFADTPEFRAMLLTLPPPSGDSSLRTTVPSAPGAGMNTDQGNLLDDLREKWLEAEAGELDKRDESALQFDKRLEMLVVVAEQENSATH